MENLSVDALREAIPVNKEEPSWLRLLDDIQLIEVYSSLKEGLTTKEILSNCINNYLPCSKMSSSKMLPDLVRFKAKATTDPRTIRAEIAEQNPEVDERLKKYVAKVDTLGRLGWLINVQTNRIDSLLAREKMGLPLNITNDGIKILGSLIDKYLSKQTALGVATTNQKQTTTTAVSVSGTMELGDITQSASRFLDLIERRSKICKVNEDGTISEDTFDKQNEEPISIVHGKTSNTA